MRKILVVIGSRAEAARMAPLARQLRGMPSMQTVVCVAAPQAQAISRELADFGISTDEELGQEADIAQGVERLIRQHKPDCVLVYGDAGRAMASFRRHAAFGNLGNGLRLYELHHHSPDGANPYVVDLIATHYFVSTESARNNLLEEGVAAEHLFLTDSTSVDTLLLALERIRADAALKAALAADFPGMAADKRLILVAGCRRDDSAARLENVCRALKRLALRGDVQVIYPRHPDPQLRDVAEAAFAGHPGIAIIEPQDYLHHVFLLQSAYLILADSDETQTEALSLPKPVLVMCDVGERPATPDAGTVKLVGTETERIVRECAMFLDDESYYRAYATHRNPRGDGHACLRIVEALLR